MAIAPTLLQKLPEEEVVYPESDGEPMAESDLHRGVNTYCLNALEARFSGRHDVYVAGDNFLYFIRGRPHAVISPDCYVVFGVDPRPRPSYKTWENGDNFPVFVLEITSASTRKEDTGRKFWLYQDTLRVPEYFLFDPTADYIATRLTGYRLGAGGYMPITPDSKGRLFSEQLGLELVVLNDQLRFYDPQRGEYLPDYNELEAQKEVAVLRAEAEAQRAEQATQRAETLEAELIQAHARLEELQRQIQEATLLQSGAGAAVKEQNDTFEN